MSDKVIVESSEEIPNRKVICFKNYALKGACDGLRRAMKDLLDLCYKTLDPTDMEWKDDEFEEPFTKKVDYEEFNMRVAIIGHRVQMINKSIQDAKEQSGII